MRTIAENLQIIKDATSDIKQAIIDKGGSISGDISTWANAISNIPTSQGLNFTAILSDNRKVGRDNYTAIHINSGVTSIEKSAFYYCYKLETVTLPNTLTTIGSAAFERCPSLREIYIPDSVTSIEQRAFRGCDGLVSVRLSNNITNIPSMLFDSCMALQTIELPNNLKTIQNEAFGFCIGLTEIVIPASVTSIGVGAFTECYGMVKYDFSNHTSIPSIAEDTFNEISSECKIVVPDALYSSWIAATNWSTYADNIINVTDYNAL